jgi:hypothetical protein
MAALPVEILLGVYLGLLTGIIPALLSGSLGFIFKYVTGVTLPGLGVVVLAVAFAGISGGLLGLVDPTVSRSPRLTAALIVVMMLSLYGHSQGDKLGATLPRRFSLRTLQRRTLSADAIDFVGGIGEVTIRPAGPVTDLEGYPPLPADLRESLQNGSWRLPADLPLSELETRLADRLRTEYDLADVTVEGDARGTARIAAAPPTSSLSRRIPYGHRAVSVSALVPTGLARGDRVRVLTDAGDVEGTVVSARSDPERASPVAEPAGDPVTDGGTPTAAVPPATTGAPTTDGGEGRVTVAVPREDSAHLLRADRGRIVVRSRGTRREYELLSLLRRAGKRIRRVEVGEGPLAGSTVGAASVRETYDVAILAIKRAEDDEPGGRRFRRRRRPSTDGARRWAFSPRGDARIDAGDELFVVGTRDALNGFEEVVG